MPTKSPPKFKLALLTWLGIYPLLTVILYFSGPWLSPLPSYVRTLILTAVLVPLMTWGMMPLLTHWFRNWLKRS